MIICRRVSVVELIDYISKYDKTDKIHFASQQSEIGMKILNENQYNNNSLNTIVFIKDQKVYTKTDALIEISKLLVGFSRVFILVQFIPKKIRDFFYTIFSKNRYRLFGKKEECMIPTAAIRNKFLS